MIQILWIKITAFFSFISLLFPSIMVLFSFVVVGFQAFALYIFVHLLSDVVGGRKGTIRVSHEHPKTKLFAVLPFGCWAAPFHPLMYLTPKKLMWIRRGVFQGCFIQPTISFLAVFLRVRCLLFLSFVFFFLFFPLTSCFSLFKLEGLYTAGDFEAQDGFTYLLVFSVASTMISVYFVFVLQRGLESSVGRTLPPFFCSPPFTRFPSSWSPFTRGSSSSS